MTIRPTVLRYGENATATGTGCERPSAAGRDDRNTGLRRDDVARADRDEQQDGGGWLVDFQPGIGGLVRAVSGGASTEPAKVQRRPWVHIEQRPAKSFSVGVLAERPLWHRKLRVERFEPDSAGVAAREDGPARGDPGRAGRSADLEPHRPPQARRGPRR